MYFEYNSTVLDMGWPFKSIPPPHTQLLPAKTSSADVNSSCQYWAWIGRKHSSECLQPGQLPVWDLSFLFVCWWGVGAGTPWLFANCCLKCRSAPSGRCLWGFSWHASARRGGGSLQKNGLKPKGCNRLSARTAFLPLACQGYHWLAPLLLWIATTHRFGRWR